jgi:Cu+-exporting ATPase
MDPTNETVTDPVCGMEVTPDTAAASVEYGDRTYYFCSPGCRTIFEMNPEKYVTRTAGESRK